MLMNILVANVIVYLTRYAIIIRQFFKSKYVNLLMEIFKWEILAYAFSLVGGYSATLCYMFLIVYEVMKFTLMSKNVLIDILTFIIPASFIYLSEKYNIIFLLPFIALFINMVLKPILHKSKKSFKLLSKYFIRLRETILDNLYSSSFIIFSLYAFISSTSSI